MSIAVQNLISTSRTHLFHANPKSPKSNLFSSTFQSQKLQIFRILHRDSPQRKFGSVAAFRWRIQASPSGGGIDGHIARDLWLDKLNLDTFLSITEGLCIAPLVVFSIGSVLNLIFSGPKKFFLVSLENRLFVWQFFLLVGAVCIGVVIRRRQWNRFYLDSLLSSSSKREGNVGLNLVERVEKLEEDLRSSVTVIRVLSRQLEKLGIRFRVTRNSLKQPIAETSALAKKNSEVTRALAMQEEVLEKELGEIQKVLLAMQEQQQKQLELILAVGKAGKVLDGRRESRHSFVEEQVVEKSNSLPKEQIKEVEMQLKDKGGQNDKV